MTGQLAGVLPWEGRRDAWADGDDPEPHRSPVLRNFAKWVAQSGSVSHDPQVRTAVRHWLVERSLSGR